MPLSLTALDSGCHPSGGRRRTCSTATRWMSFFKKGAGTRLAVPRALCFPTPEVFLRVSHASKNNLKSPSYSERSTREPVRNT
jgi:hypothetical protein